MKITKVRKEINNEKGMKKKREFLRKIAKKKDVIIDEMCIKEKGQN